MFRLHSANTAKVVNVGAPCVAARARSASVSAVRALSRKLAHCFADRTCDVLTARDSGFRSTLPLIFTRLTTSSRLVAACSKISQVHLHGWHHSHHQPHHLHRRRSRFVCARLTLMASSMDLSSHDTLNPLVAFCESLPAYHNCVDFFKGIFLQLTYLKYL